MDLFDFDDLPPLRDYEDLFKPIRIDSPGYLLCWLAVFGGFAFALQRWIVRPEKLKIRFYITDFWAATLALAPTFYLLTRLQRGEIDWRLSGLFVLCLVSTLIGIRAGLVLHLPRKGEPLPGRWKHFCAVLFGGLAGLFGVFATGFLYEVSPPVAVFSWVVFGGAVFLWFFLCYLMPPLIVASAGCFYIFKKAMEPFFR